jgi:hypothetical protein
VVKLAGLVTVGSLEDMKPLGAKGAAQHLPHAFLVFHQQDIVQSLLP